MGLSPEKAEELIGKVQDFLTEHNAEKLKASQVTYHKEQLMEANSTEGLDGALKSIRSIIYKYISGSGKEETADPKLVKLVQDMVNQTAVNADILASSDPAAKARTSSTTTSKPSLRDEGAISSLPARVLPARVRFAADPAEELKGLPNFIKLDKLKEFMQDGGKHLTELQNKQYIITESEQRDKLVVQYIDMKPDKLTVLNFRFEGYEGYKGYSKGHKNPDEKQTFKDVNELKQYLSQHAKEIFTTKLKSGKKLEETLDIDRLIQEAVEAEATHKPQTQPLEPMNITDFKGNDFTRCKAVIDALAQGRKVLSGREGSKHNTGEGFTGALRNFFHIANINQSEKTQLLGYIQDKLNTINDQSLKKHLTDNDQSLKKHLTEAYNFIKDKVNPEVTGNEQEVQAHRPPPLRAKSGSTSVKDDDQPPSKPLPPLPPKPVPQEDNKKRLIPPPKPGLKGY